MCHLIRTPGQLPLYMRRLIFATMALLLFVSLCPNGARAAEASLFEDVGIGHWAYAYIEETVDQGLFLGTGDATFEPDAAVSRAMALTVLHRFSGGAAGEADPSALYPDVPAGAWYAEAVVWAADLGLLADIAADSFEPDAPITRQNMMVLIHRYFHSIGLSMPFVLERSLATSLTDYRQINDYAQEAILAGRWARIMVGFLDGTYGPQESLTRAQAAAVFSRCRAWQQVQAAHTPLESPIDMLEEHPIWDTSPFYMDLVHLTSNGYAAVYTYDGHVMLYDIEGQRLVADMAAEGLLCHHIHEDDQGVTFHIVTQEAFPELTAVEQITITWQGEITRREADTFVLPWGDGFVEERELGLDFHNPATGERRTLVRFTEDIGEDMGGPGFLRLRAILDENRFVYTAKLDAWALQTYVYDMRTGQSTAAPFNIYLGHADGYVLGSFSAYGLEGMVVADLDTLDEISRISYNNAGPSRAMISADGALVLAIYDVGENEHGALLLSAQTGQLLEVYDFSALGLGSIGRYGFYGQRPYFTFYGDGTVEGHRLFLLPGV